MRVAVHSSSSPLFTQTFTKLSPTAFLGASRSFLAILLRYFFGTAHSRTYDQLPQVALIDTYSNQSNKAAQTKGTICVFIFSSPHYLPSTLSITVYFFYLIYD